VEAEYGARYRELYRRHWWWRARERLILDTLRPHAASGRLTSILDVGCGDGLFFDAAMSLPGMCHIEGVEPEGALLNADGPHRKRIHGGPFDDSYAPGRVFSAVVFLDVLEHLTAPDDALRRASSLLEPGGFILATVPAFMSLWTRHDLLNHHVTRYTRTTFNALLRRSNLRAEESRYFFHWTAAAKVGTRLLEAVVSGEPASPKVPPAPINQMLYWLSRAEERLGSRLSIPFGSSLMVIARPA
jgi:SAM-dependent methyltransferase